jgi:hypothetical protein
MLGACRPDRLLAAGTVEFEDFASDRTASRRVSRKASVGWKGRTIRTALNEICDAKRQIPA